MKAVGSHSSRPRYEEKTPTPAGQSSFLQPYCWLFTQTFLIALFNYRIFSYKEKNTWWAWQVAYHHNAGIGWYSSVHTLSNGG